MGFLDTLLGRTKPVQPKLDDLFCAPVCSDNAGGGSGFHPDGRLCLLFRPVEGGRLADVQKDVPDLLDMSAGQEGAPFVEVSKDDYGFTWVVDSRMSSEIDALVTDLHAVNSALVDNGFGPQPPIVHPGLPRRGGTPGPDLPVQAGHASTLFAPLAYEKRDNALELQVKGAIPVPEPEVEQDLGRWFPVWAGRPRPVGGPTTRNAAYTAYRWDCTGGRLRRAHAAPEQSRSLL